MTAFNRAVWDHNAEPQHLHGGGASADRPRSGRQPCATHGDLAGGLRRRVADDLHLLTVEGDLISRYELFDEADLDAALARFDELNRPAPRLENAASRVDERFSAIHGPRLGRHGRDIGRRRFSRRSSSGRERGRPTWSRCRDCEHAGDRRPRVDEHGRRPSSRPAGSASSSAVSASRAATSGPRPFDTDVLDIVEINADNRIAATRRVRPRRHRRRHRGTRRPVSRRRSRRPRTHVVGHRAELRRVQPARAPFDDARLGDHRPPARDIASSRAT